jgi:CheY-like chemotaxis protein
MVTDALKDQGIEVIAVGHGEAAVRKLPEVKPDLILADVFMPVRNGYEVCEFVKKDERFAHIPVVLLVGAFDPVDQHEVKRVQADGLLKKPFAPLDDLKQMVSTMLAKSAAAQAAPSAKPPATPPAETVELTPAEMQQITRGGAAQEMAVPPPIVIEETVEELTMARKPLEFAAGEQPVAFDGFGTPVAEIRAEEEEGESEEEEEGEEEEEAAEVGESAFASGGFDQIETAPSGVAEPAGVPEYAAPTEAVPPAPAIEEQPGPPQYGGIEVPPREPAPDEPPIAVTFESSSEELEIVREETPSGVSSYVSEAPPQELASSAQEFMDATVPPSEITRSSFDDTAIMEAVKPEEIAAAARRAEERARAAAETAVQETVEEIPSGSFSEVKEMPASEFGVPSMTEAAAPAAVAGAAAIGYSALSTPPAEVPEPLARPPLEWIKAPPPPAEEIAPESSTVFAAPMEPAAPERPMFTGKTDALSRPHVDEELVEAVADRVLEQIQGGILDKLTKDILRPIIEALIAQELDKKP